MSSVAVSLAESDAVTTAHFSIQARAEPGVLPRLIELFAKRGMIPASWRSTTDGPEHAELTIEIEMRGLSRHTIDYIAASMRQIASVRTVLTAESGARAFA